MRHNDGIDRTRQFELEAELALEKDKNELSKDHPYLKPTTRSKLRHSERYYPRKLREDWARWQAVAADAYKQRRITVSLSSVVGEGDLELSLEQLSKLRVKIVREL